MYKSDGTFYCYSYLVSSAAEFEVYAAAYNNYNRCMCSDWLSYMTWTKSLFHWQSYTIIKMCNVIIVAICWCPVLAADAGEWFCLVVRWVSTLPTVVEQTTRMLVHTLSVVLLMVMTFSRLLKTSRLKVEPCWRHDQDVRSSCLEPQELFSAAKVTVIALCLRLSSRLSRRTRLKVMNIVSDVVSLCYARYCCFWATRVSKSYLWYH